MPASVVKPGQEGDWNRAKKSAGKQLKPGTDQYWALVNYIFGKMTHRKNEMKAEGPATSKYAYTDSKGNGHLPIGDKAHVRNAIARYNQTHFESDAKAKAAWSAIRGAAHRFGIKMEDDSKPAHKTAKPSEGYDKKVAAAAVVAAPPLVEPGTARFAIAISADDSGAPLEWIELMPAGKFSAIDGRGPFKNQDPLKIIEASLARMPKVGAVVDYDHSTDLAAPEGRPAPAAGWIKQLRAQNGAIFAQVEWTADAADALKAKKYRYISPVFEHDDENCVERILRAALTNNPALTQLPAIAAAQGTQTMAMAREGMTVAELMKHFPPRPNEAASDHLKRLMRHAAIEEDSADDAENDMKFGEWADDEMEGHKNKAGDDPYDDSMKDGDDDDGKDAEGDGYLAAKKDEDMQYEDEELTARHRSEDAELAKKHEDEMADCPPSMRARRASAHKDEDAELAAKHESEQEEARHKAMSRRREAASSRQIAPRPDRRVVRTPVKASISAKERAQMVNDSIASHPMMVAMAKQLNDMKLKELRTMATQKVDRAIREGRLIPSHRTWGIEYCVGNSKGFDEFISLQPCIVQHGADNTFTARIGEPKHDANAVFSQKDLGILANLGITEKDRIEQCAAGKEKWRLRFDRPRMNMDDSNWLERTGGEH